MVIFLSPFIFGTKRLQVAPPLGLKNQEIKNHHNTILVFFHQHKNHSH